MSFAIELRWSEPGVDLADARLSTFDAEANARNRGAAQGFIAFILWGVGSLVGTWLAGKTLAAHTLASPQGAILHDWKSIWMTPAIGAAVVLVVFLIFFREPAKGSVHQ